MEKFDVVSLLLLICAGTIVGVMFSLITIVSKSIWSSALVHTLWNFAIIGQILDISTKHNTKSVYSFVLSSKNVLITGGSFGVESSLVAISGYIIVVLLSLYMLRRVQK